MMIEQELIEQKLFELIESREFHALTPDEKSFVLRHMEQEEYIAQHDSILQIIEVEKEKTELNPSESIAKNLFKEEKVNWLETVKDIFKVKVPAMALVLPVLLLISFFFFQGNNKNESLYSSNDSTQVDTLIASIDSSTSSISMSENPYSKYANPMYRY